MPVATRRRVKEADLTSEPDPELALRKKPVRKAAARGGNAETAAEGKKTRATSTRDHGKNEIVPESTHETTSQSTNAARRQTGRAKKAAAPVEHVDTEATLEPPPVAKATRSTRAASVRSRNGEVAVDILPDLTVSEKPRSTRQSRATASRKVQPLSPKKISQVSNGQRKNEATLEPKAENKDAVQPANRGRGGGKRRAVSDENAVSQSVGVMDEEQDEEGAELANIPVARAVASTRTTRRRGNSIRSTTSRASRKRTTSRPRHAQAATTQDDEQSDCHSVSSTRTTDDNGADSEDELAGPKTPMKRCSPGAEERYRASVKSTIRRINRTFEPSMDLDVTLESEPESSLDDTRETDSPSAIRPQLACTAAVDETMGEEEDEPSFFPDEDILQDDDQVEAFDTPHANANPQLLSPPSSHLDESEATTVIMDPTAEDQTQHAVMQDLTEDSDETVLIHQPDEDFAAFDTTEQTIGSPTESPAPAAVWQDEPEDSLIEDYDDALTAHDTHKLSQPETLIWANLRQDQTITVNFDHHLANVRSNPHQESAGDASEPAENLKADDFVAAVVNRIEEGVSGLGRGRRETVDFNDFVDIAALAASPVKRSLPLTTNELGTATASDRSSLAHSDNVPASEETEAELEQSASPAEVPELAEQDGIQHNDLADPDVPHYALSTHAFDARRKSMPAFGMRTPLKQTARPSTSDGASIARLPRPIAWPISSHDLSRPATPSRSRPSTSQSQMSPTKDRSPVRRSVAPSAPTTPARMLSERITRLSADQGPVEQVQTVAAPTRFRMLDQTPAKRRATVHRLAGTGTPAKASAEPTSTAISQTPVSDRFMTPNERRPRLAPRNTYEEHAATIAGPSRFTALLSGLNKRRRETVHQVHHEEQSLSLAEPSGTEQPLTIPEPIMDNSPTPATTATLLATPQERYPRLKPRDNYEQHAKTVAAPARFQTPAKSPIRRPATTQKAPDTLRKAAMRANAIRGASTPTTAATTPTAPAATPSQVPMTPHPGAPLRGVVALVEVFTLEGSSASAPFVALLHRLGARTARSWSERVTHVVFKDGSPLTLQRVRLQNRDAASSATPRAVVFCVNSRWVTDCDRDGVRRDEADDAYAVDVTDVPRGGKRRRKSMEPAALRNLNGSVVRGERKSSLGRSSLGRAAIAADSPVKSLSADEISHGLLSGDVTPEAAFARGQDGSESPVTPAWIAAPDQLVQQTAPMNRVRRLEIKGDKDSKNRRLTFWDGAA